MSSLLHSKYINSLILSYKYHNLDDAVENRRERMEEIENNKEIEFNKEIENNTTSTENNTTSKEDNKEIVNNTLSEWSINTWRTYTLLQQPTYPTSITTITSQLSQLPPIVSIKEISSLKLYLKEVSKGKLFILQGGDCAERYIDCNYKIIKSKLNILLAMSLILTVKSNMPILRIGRIAGQYSKPRSKDTESIDNKVIPCFRGDAINDYDLNKREHDPQRLLLAYFYSSTTMNLIRYSSTSLYDIINSTNWCDSELSKYDDLCNEVSNLLKCSKDKITNIKNNIEVYTSHEGLVLEYESALTRYDNNTNQFYDLSAHFLWIGERTRQLDSAHIEFFRGIANPIGIKLGHSTSPEELVELIQKLNPSNETGKIILVSRLGCNRVKSVLPQLIDTIQFHSMNVIWICDPMHGNTEMSNCNLKTRSFNNILMEIIETQKIHVSAGSIFGGVHFEMTSEHVTECLGGPDELLDNHLPNNYTTYCDPRLNCKQSIEMAFKLAELISQASNN